MQLEFQKDKLACMQPVLQDTQQQEQTQEVRISDGMPDIGNILSCWGQVILRGKEWDADTLTVNGGTMVWVQYMPEEGRIPETVECWLPFQLRWNLPDAHQEGILLTQTQLKSVDARTTSARKMIIRTNVSVRIAAMEHCQKQVFIPNQVPEDVQLQSASYPVLLTAEAGEKAFSLEETFSAHEPGKQAEKICAYWIQPEISEYRIMNDKVVFRGNAILQALCRCTDGSMYSKSFELPFSQYSELDAEYGDDAEAVFWPAITSLETELEEDNVRVKVGLTGQYEIRKRPVIQVVTDAYSPQRDVLPQLELLELPGILESKMQTIHAKLGMPVDGVYAAAAQFYPHLPELSQTDSSAQILLQGHFQNLIYDLEGTPQNSSSKWEQQMQIPKGADSHVDVRVMPVGVAQSSMLSGQLQQQIQLQLQTDTRMDTGIPMLTGLDLGELRQPDPGRPSLILRRAGDHTLWELAKNTGSTIADIMQANNLQGEPDTEQMLLIPVK